MVDKRYLEPVASEPKEPDYQAALDALIGMAGPKAEVARLANLAKMAEKRKVAGLPALTNSFHMVFTGNPGTGKTTFARIIAKVLHQHGILPKEGIVEVDRSTLVGMFVGHSEAAVKKKLDEALGRVLFIDEFYGLVTEGGGNDFGARVIDVLVKYMEDHRENLCVIAAGYTEPMQKAIASNPGLKSRFTRTIHFDDYSEIELIDIFDAILLDKKFSLADDAYPVVGKVIKAHHAGRKADFGNARDIRTLFERVTDVQADRTMTDDSDITIITADDVKRAAVLCGMT
jgi:stage V sporulation protein K